MNRLLAIPAALAAAHGRWWRARQRAVDLAYLWPVCREQAPDIGTARLAFWTHAARDHAWTRDFTLDEIQRQMEELV